MSNNKFLADFSTMATAEQMSGKHLKLVRIWVGLRQYEVAARIGIPATKLCEIEADRRHASPELIAKILDAMEEGLDDKTR